jgi:hypothetical protein
LPTRDGIANSAAVKVHKKSCRVTATGAGAATTTLTARAATARTLGTSAATRTFALEFIEEAAKFASVASTAQPNHSSKS